MIMTESTHLEFKNKANLPAKYKRVGRYKLFRTQHHSRDYFHKPMNHFKHDEKRGFRPFLSASKQ